MPLVLGADVRVVNRGRHYENCYPVHAVPERCRVSGEAILQGACAIPYDRVHLASSLQWHGVVAGPTALSAPLFKRSSTDGGFVKIIVLHDQVHVRVRSTKASAVTMQCAVTNENGEYRSSRSGTTSGCRARRMEAPW